MEALALAQDALASERAPVMGVQRANDNLGVQRADDS